jgi:hypothetical protein
MSRTSLIGLSGYISSGKDTVGSIIQYLAAKEKRPDIFFPANSPQAKEAQLITIKNIGENTDKRDITENSGWEIKKFAGKLKQIASLLTGIPVEKFEDQEFKKTFLPEMWNYTGPSMDGGKYGICTDDLGEQQMMVRQFLQKLGTEAMRDGLHTNVWVNALFADFKLTDEVVFAVPGNPLRDDPNYGIPQYPKWIITDCRFPNEAQAIKDRGGIVVRVNRPPAGSTKLDLGELGVKYAIDKRDVPTLHPSETSLDTWEFDYILDNNSSIEELTLKVKEMLQHFGIINLKNEPQSVGG